MPEQPPCFEAKQDLEGDSRTPDLCSFKAEQQWLLCYPPWPAQQLHLRHDITHHKALCPIHHSVLNWCRQTSVSAAFLLFEPEREAVGKEGMSEICPFPALWQLWEEEDDHIARRVGGQQSLWTEEQQRWSVKPCAHWGQRQISQEIPWSQTSCTKKRQREPEAWKCSQGSWFLVFFLALQIQPGKYKIFYALAEAYFSLWGRRERRIS